MLNRCLSIGATVLVVLIILATASSGDVPRRDRNDSGLNARSVLIELGKKLEKIPDTKAECQAKLREIKAWQVERLKELDKEFQITSPPDGGIVTEDIIRVSGTGASPGGKIWIIVHPMKVQDHWIQSTATVRTDGTWRASAHVGRPGRDYDQNYEIAAVLNPSRALETGTRLREWPKGEALTEVVEVTKMKK